MTNPLQRLVEFAKCRRGSIAVEFAMLMPIMILMIFGIVAFGSYLAVVHGIQQLAAEAARSSIAGLNNTERASIASSYVASNAATYPLIDAAHLTVNAATSAVSSTVFVVTVNYDASGMFIYALPLAIAPPTMISRSAAVPYGGF